jgi:hypothetical protein
LPYGTISFRISRSSTRASTYHIQAMIVDHRRMNQEC